MKQTPLTTRRWQRAEFARLVGLGAFHGEAIELIGGQLMVAEPQGAYHAAAINAVDYALRAILPAGWIVRVQSPTSLDDESEPEPDLAVVSGRPEDYRFAHPSRPVLVIEVSESSVAFDREQKGSLYARAGIADYWLVNLVERTLELYREPEPDPHAPYGWRYRVTIVLQPPAHAAPLAFADRAVVVADLLP